MTQSVTDEWLARVRGDFPYRQGRVYLLTAAVGLPFPGAAAAAGQYYVNAASFRSDAMSLRHRPATSARERVARLLGVPGKEVGFFRNTSEVVNLAANGMEWHSGDEVIVLTDEFPCNVVPWTVAERAGATVVRVDPGDGHERQQRLLDALTPKTRVMSVSHVHYLTGTRLDLNLLGRACRKAGALFVVDGIQAVGATPVDLSYVDVYGAAVFKWLLSGSGTAIGVFRERARSMLTPVFRSYGNPPPSTSAEYPAFQSYGNPSPTTTFEYAAPNYPGLFVLDATLAYLEELGWERIFDRVDALASYLLDALDKMQVDVTTPPDAHAGIVCIRGLDSPAVAEGMKQRGLDVSGGLGPLLVSPHFYNSHEDIDRFVDALETALRS